MARITSFRETGERYPVLRVLVTIGNVVGILLMTLAVLVFLAGVASFLEEFVGPIRGLYLGMALVWAFGLFFTGVQCIAIASFLKLAIHVEENTRATAQALDRLRSSLEPKTELDDHSIFLS